MNLLRTSLSLAVAAALALTGCRKEERLPRPPDTAAVTNAVNVLVAMFAADGDYRRIDAKDLRVCDFRRELAAVSPRATLWMPGEHDWLILGANRGMTNALGAAMEAFASLDTTLSFPDVFCAYVGTVAETLPAFEALAPEAVVAPQNFVTKEIPDLPWLDVSGVDEDIRQSTLSEIRSVQLVRREVIEGNMLAAVAKDHPGERKAIEVWARAALRNPDDTFLVERLERLERNASGFRHLGRVLQAMKCYETMMLIRPTATRVHNFGMCLKRLGKLDLAEQVLARAREMEKAERAAK